MQDYSPSFYSFSHSNVVDRHNQCTQPQKYWCRILPKNTWKKHVKKYRQYPYRYCIQKVLPILLVALCHSMETLQLSDYRHMHKRPTVECQVYWTMTDYIHSLDVMMKPRVNVFSNAMTNIWPFWYLQLTKNPHKRCR